MSPSPDASPTAAAQPRRLPDRALGLPPPLFKAFAYPVNDHELLDNADFAAGLRGWSASGRPHQLVTSQVQPRAKALLVHSQAMQQLSPTKLESRKSYRLSLTTSGAGCAAVRFRRPNRETVRDYETCWAKQETASHVLEFTAPAYARLAEVRLAPSAAGMKVDRISLKMRPPIRQTEPISSWSGSFVPPGYSLAFNDEFTGSRLDATKWHTRYIYASGTLDRLNDEQQRYADQHNHVVANGILELVARRVSEPKTSRARFVSGMIRSDWTTRFGFFEARVKMPSARGVWPAFWLNSDVSATGRLSWPPEIDIFELVNNGKDDKLNELHCGVRPKHGSGTRMSYAHDDFIVKQQKYVAPYEFDDDWHTIGAEWTKSSVTFYVDGVKIASTPFEWKYKDGSLAAPAHILINLAIGGAWAGRYGVDAGAFPQALQVDWVRVYKPEP